MIMRALKPEDIKEIYDIWLKYYSNEFLFPSLDKFLGAATFLDDNGRIISAGGVRLIPEAVLITDKNYHARKRWFAIQELLQFGDYVCSSNGFNELNAFVSEKGWSDHLRTLGFKDTFGKSLVRNITNG